MINTVQKQRRRRKDNFCPAMLSEKTNSNVSGLVFVLNATFENT
jgi:hypothetical protein